MPDNLALQEQAPALTGDRLLERLRRGEEAAFELLIRRHNRRLYRIARSVLRSDAEAEEVVQQAYVTAFTRLDSFRGPDGLGAWLGRIALNLALDAARQRSRFRSIDDPLDEAPRIALERQLALDRLPADPEAQLARQEMKQVLERAIDRLPRDFRIVFVLRAVEGLSAEETASVLGLRPETVGSRLHRARAALRRRLREEAVSSLSAVFPFAGARCDRITAAVLAQLVRRAATPPDDHHQRKEE